MYSIFDRFTSKKPFFRGIPISSIPPSTSVRILNSVPVWVREVTKTSSYPLTGILPVKKEDQLLYSVGPWLAYSANPNQLSFVIPEVCKVLRPPKQGLAVALTEGVSRIKGLRLSDALIYSYLNDLRFVLLTCLLIGFSVWWVSAPEQLLEKPAALCSPDLEIIVRVLKDTFINKMCSTHYITSPCDCGEPLNKTARSLFEPPEIESFDPLGIKPNPNKVKALSVLMGSIIIILTLSESVSSRGYLCSYFEY